MSFAARLLAPVRAGGDPMDDRYYGDQSGRLALSGVPVTPETSLKLGAVYACVRALSDPLSWLPLVTYQRQANGDRQRAAWNPLYEVLHDQPNRWQTAREWKKLMMTYALLRGDGISRKLPGPRGDTDQLIPIHPDRIVNIGQASDYSLVYKIRTPDGRNVETLLQDEVFHLRGFTLDGIRGVSVLEYARETVGLGLALDEYAARFFSQNAVPAAVITHPGAPSRNARRRIRDEWESSVSGLANAHRAVVLGENMTVTPLSLNNEDSQFLQTRQFGVEEVGRWFGVPLHKLQSTTKETSWGSGIEEMNLMFIAEALMPWAVSWEQAVRRDLIIDQRNYYSEFLFDALLRGKLLERYQGYHYAITDGWMTRAEPRQKENFNRIDGLDQPLRPANTLPADGNGAVGSYQDRDEADLAGLANGHYLSLLHEAAARIVRKEAAALGKTWTRLGGDPAAWAEAVGAFCAEHAAYVAQTMCVSQADAAGYVARLDMRLSGCGDLADIQDADGRRVAQLMALGES